MITKKFPQTTGKGYALDGRKPLKLLDPNHCPEKSKKAKMNFTAFCPRITAYQKPYKQILFLFYYALPKKRVKGS